MKMKPCYLFIFLVSILFVGCEKKPALYSEADGIYFGTADTTVSYSFAKYPKKVSDTLFIPVQVLGKSFSSDRSIPVELIPTVGDSAAVEGIHFKILDQAIIAAGAVTGDIKILVNRTADLEDGKAVHFSLRIKKNADFPSDGIALRQKVTINLAFIQRPSTWGEYTGAITGYFAGYRDNFGTWTPSKYKIILDALYDEETGTTVSEFPFTRYSPPVQYNQYVAIVRNYIKVHYPGNYGLPGAILLDPDYDNMPVQVGPANY